MSALLYLLGLAVATVSLLALWTGDRPGASSLIILTAAYVPYAAVGSILVARRPRNLIGWVLIGMGWTFAVSFLPITATADELQTMTASPLEVAIVWLADVTVSLTFALFALLAFCYPTGRLAAGRSRRFATPVLVLILGTVVISAFWPVLTAEVPGTARIVEFPNPIGLLRLVDFGLPSESLGTHLAVRHARVARRDRRSLPGLSRPRAAADALARCVLRGDRTRCDRRSRNRDPWV